MKGSAANMGYEQDSLYVGGSWTTAGGEPIEVRSPSSEERIGRAASASVEDVDLAVEAARASFDHGEWSHWDPRERAEKVRLLAKEYEAISDQLAATLCDEVGHPITYARGRSVAGGAGGYRYFADLAEDFAWEETRQGALGPLVVRREPVGVVAAVAPWNSPYILVANKLAPALVAGCSIIVKTAPEAALCGYALAEAIDKVGFPPGVISVFTAGREESEHLVSHPGVDKVAFTGSVETGRRVLRAAAENITRVTLELGGKSAAIILDDADPAVVIPTLLPAAMSLSGQICVTHSRIVVHRSLYDSVIERLTEAIGGLVVGDPHDEATQVGPLVSARQRERVEGHIANARADGARLVLGGGRPAGFDTGHYVEPTIFVDVDPDSRLAQEEVFGPVLAVIPADDEEHAVAIANNSSYGLGGTVWTGDDRRGLEVARRVRTGTFGVNRWGPDVSTPFGGMKQSGLGRENGPEGLTSYVEFKSIAVPAPGEG